MQAIAEVPLVRVRRKQHTVATVILASLQPQMLHVAVQVIAERTAMYVQAVYVSM